jgi:hypothetical protein
MHDGLARQYEPDTEVVDERDLDQERQIAMPRVATEDLIMHVRDEAGNWHRRHPRRLETACGQKWMNWGYQNERSGRLIEPPLAACDCWSKAEREEADESEKLRAIAIKGSVF